MGRAEESGRGVARGPGFRRLPAKSAPVTGPAGRSEQTPKGAHPVTGPAGRTEQTPKGAHPVTGPAGRTEQTPGSTSRQAPVVPLSWGVTPPPPTALAAAASAGPSFKVGIRAATRHAATSTRHRARRRRYRGGLPPRRRQRLSPPLRRGLSFSARSPAMAALSRGRRRGPTMPSG